VAPSRPDIVSNEDLPPYLIEPPPTTGWDYRQLLDGFARVRQAVTAAPRAPAPQPPASPSVPFGGRTPMVSPVFARMVPLPRDGLAAALDAWWAAEAKTGAVTVQRRLRLGPPEGDASAGWTMGGRLRRLTTLHWVPVTLELWPTLADFTIVTMTPRVRIHTSNRYFRVGHATLDRLCDDLGEISARLRLAPRST
jgi:hypothetical protein